MPRAEPARLLIVDDHAIVRAGLAALLQGAPGLRVVHAAADGAEALALWPVLRPDLALVDLSMPGLDGFATLSALRDLDPRARLIALTTLGTEEHVYRALRAGASGFLLKDCALPELLQAIREVLAGGRYLQPQAAERLAGRLTQPALTVRETEVLQWLAQGLSNKHIARHLALAEGTVKTHVKAILAKLGADTRTQAVATALTRGLLAPPLAA